MQILMSASAYERIKLRLHALEGRIDVLTLQPDGTVMHGAARVSEDVDPEAYWVSLDTYRTSLVNDFFGRITRGSNAKWAQVFTAGLDNPAFKTLLAKGVRIAKSDAQSPPIAEYVIAQALSLLHPIAEQQAAQANCKWQRVTFREIAETRWLLIGYGAIGREIAKRLAPFGADLTIVRRNPQSEPLANKVTTSADILSLLPNSDVVILACALNDTTRGMAGPAFFNAMKPGAILINIARGGLIDETALKTGLAREQPGHAVLDVFETEPLPADAWFWTHPRVRVTAHTSNAGNRVVARGDDLFLENLARYTAGQRLRNEASPSEVGL